jgi:hypothetical protein
MLKRLARRLFTHVRELFRFCVSGNNDQPLQFAILFDGRVPMGGLSSSSLTQNT